MILCNYYTRFFTILLLGCKSVRPLMPLLLSCLLIQSILSQDVVVDPQNKSSIRIDCLSTSYKSQLHDFLPEHFYVNNVEFDVDFLCDQSQLLYVTGLHNNETYTCEQLLSACFYLKQLDRFKKIEVSIKKDGLKYSITFHLVGNLMFSKLVMSGCMRDKDFYKNMYMIDVSDLFDVQKHQHSIDQIQQYFYDKGYCNARIIDTIKEDKKQKKVAVRIELDKGPKFVIEKVVFDVQAVGNIAQVDVLRMKKMIEDVCYNRLRAKVFSNELLKKIKGKIKFLLERYGFMDFDLVVTKKIDEVRHRVDLRVAITLEQKKEFVFLGNHFFKKQEILDRLLMYGKSSWHFPSSIIIDELVQLYKSKGFWNVTVSVREEKNRVFCLINEGVRVAVSSVGFKDNTYFPAKELEKGSFKHFVRSKFFDKELCKKSTEQLIRFYKHHGFWDIKIVQEEFVPIEQGVKYQLLLTLDEGDRRKIGVCSIPGYSDLESVGPFAVIKKEGGADFDYTTILDQKQWLLHYFRNLGYGKVAIEYELQDDGDRLNIVWFVSLKDQAVKFGKVVIKGNSIVPTSSIMREVAFGQGEDWDKTKLEETLKRLRELKVFDLVQVYPGRELDDNLEKPIFIKVIDASRYEFRTRMGVQQVGKDFRLGRGTTYKIGGSFLIRNPFCMADTLVFDGDFTRYYRNAALSYQFPWLFGKSIRCQYKVYDTVYDQPIYIGSKLSLYQAGQRGFLFNMTKSFTQTTVSGNVGVEFMGIKEADQPDLQKIIDYDKRLLDKKVGYVFFEPNVMWQKVDNLLNPKKGHLSFASCKAMVDTNAKTSFFKLLIEHSFYTPIIDRLTLAVRMRGGHVFNRCYNQLIPIERFYLGGASTLRGYERDYCPPLGLLTVPVKDEYNQLPPSACNLWRYAPQGGRTMVNLNTELRFSMFKGLGGVVFNDVGALFKDSIFNALKDQSDNFLGGSGFGLRYDTPIGPLRFDVGFKWNRVYKDFETRCVWYLTLGHAF